MTKSVATRNLLGLFLSLTWGLSSFSDEAIRIDHTSLNKMIRELEAAYAVEDEKWVKEMEDPEARAKTEASIQAWKKFTDMLCASKDLDLKIQYVRASYMTEISHYRDTQTWAEDDPDLMVESTKKLAEYEDKLKAFEEAVKEAKSAP